MRYQYIPYMVPLIFSAFVSLALGVYLLLIKKSQAKGARLFVIMAFLLTVWSFANAMEMAALDLTTKIFWANMQYIAYCYFPVAWLALCLQITNHDNWIKSKKYLWVAVIPTLIIILAWTDSWHNLIRFDMQLDNSGSFPVIDKEYGPVFFVHATYAYFLDIFAGLLLLRTIFLGNKVYRKQATVLLLGFSFIVIPNLLYVLGLSPVERIDITPIFFAPAGLITAWGIFRFNLFEVIPVARATVIETMDSGMMVLDLQDRVLDINPAFSKIVGFNASQIINKKVEDVCKHVPELVEVIHDKRLIHSEFPIDINGVSKVYEGLLSPLTDSEGAIFGKLLVIYDITEKKMAEHMFAKQQWKLAVTVERERMAKDMHDNLSQILSFINIQAQGIRQELRNAGVDIGTDKLDKLVKVTQSAHQDIRAYIRDARSLAAVETNFMLVLTKEIMWFEEQTGLKIELDITHGFTGEELKLETRSHLLYIIKEALNNIRKHAVAEHVKIVLSMTQEQLLVLVEDDGIGFDIKRDVLAGSLGIEIMQERAKKMGSKISIQSTTGQGTKVKVLISMKKGSEMIDETHAS